ncbi:hypothetical protein H4217_004124 [Coemansia sp. RSA 1939]|nr:hypothetical protein H4217_004124 [Coemansia sp. RSA 1939]KAJ2607200.1 hypothetical protein EV177_005650 [Coemansia sp. RSA 1804]KAJ2693766.1 hypothetical protein GGH99_001002 [Coemansia sp. RSA 1285]
MSAAPTGNPGSTTPSARAEKPGTNSDNGPHSKETHQPKSKPEPRVFSMMHLLKTDATQDDENMRFPPRVLSNWATEDAIILDTSIFPTENAALIAVKAICIPVMADYRPKWNKLMLAFDLEEEADLVLYNPPVYNGTTVKVTRPIPRTAAMTFVNIHVIGAEITLRMLVHLLKDALSPHGKICDLCVNVYDEIISCNATAILDRENKKGPLPSRIYKDEITISLYGRSLK